MTGLALAKLLSDPEPQLLDGGLATELENLGADLNHPLWSARILASAPDLIARVHEAYYQAGARFATTATYQASIAGFLQQGYSQNQAQLLLLSAVELADKVRNAQPNAEKLLVAASIGPFGAYLADGSEYRGDYGLDRRQLYQFHEPRWCLLRDTAADCFACETIPSLEEAQALAELASHYPQPYWLSFSCCDEQHLADGTKIDYAVQQLLSASHPPVAVGVNCTAPRFILPLLEHLQKCELGATRLLVYPNSGEHYDASNKCWHGQADVQRFTTAAEQWLAAGANWIGGCCRTTPAHIQALASSFKDMSLKR